MYDLLFLIGLYSPKNTNKSIWNESLALGQFFYNRRSFPNVEPTLMEGPKCWFAIKFFMKLFHTKLYYKKK